jgi:antitoxin ChpS
MHTTNLRKVGGSVMMAVPPAILEIRQLGAGSTVGVTIENGRLVVAPQRVKRPTLDDLLAECDPKAPLPSDWEWTDAPAVGGELI